MKVSDKGLALIKEFEGLYLKAYTDSVGVWTIGWGITNSDKAITGTTIRKGLTISRSTAEKWLRESLDKKYGPKVMKYDHIYHWNQNQYDAMVSFAYNIGSIDQLTANGTRSKDEIARKIFEYSKAGGKFLRGLYRRRKAEHDLFCTPCAPVITNKKLLSYLSKCHSYIKENHKYFYNHYDKDMTTFEKAEKAVKAKKKVGLTCVVPLRWALAELGIKREDGKSLISGDNGSFKQHYTGGVKKIFTRISSGKAIGLTPKEAIDKGLLRSGDIVCYEKHTHTSVYSGSGYHFYEGGSQCAQYEYAKGIKMNYEKYPYKISEILRFKDEYFVKEETKKNKEAYKMPMIKKGSKGKAVKIWQIILGIDADGDFGVKTDEATKKFQKERGLTVDGVVGPWTWGAGIETLPE